MFLLYIALQLFYSYKFWYVLCYFPIGCFVLCLSIIRSVQCQMWLFPLVVLSWYVAEVYYYYYYYYYWVDDSVFATVSIQSNVWRRVRYGKVSPCSRPRRPLGRVEVQLHSFVNSALDGGGWSSRPGLFTPGKDPVSIVQEAGWAPGPVWIGAENLAPTGIRSPDRPVRRKSLYRIRYPAPKCMEK